MFQIDPAQKPIIFQDALNELGNIGAGNAATALSQMMQTTIRLSVTTVRLVTIADIAKLIDAQDTALTGVHLHIVGDIKGSMFFLLRSEAVDSLVSAMMCGMDPSTIPDEMKQSALQEVGNIITASYINSISQMTNLVIDESVPTVITDTVDNIFKLSNVSTDKLLFVQSKLRADGAAVEGFFVFVPDQPSFAILMKGLGM